MIDDRAQPDAERPEPVAGTPARLPDPGSRSAGRLTLLLLVPVLLVVVGLQQWSVIGSGAEIQQRAREEVLPPIAGDGFTLVSKMMVKFDALLSDMEGEERSTNSGQFAYQIDSMAVSPSEQIRATMVMGELVSEKEALDRLDANAEAVLNATIGEQGLGTGASAALLDDIESLEKIYEGTPLNDNERLGLVDRHGWFGELALTHGGADPIARNRLTGGGGLLLVLLVTVGAVMILAFLGGLAMLIMAIVFGATGRVRARFVPPAPGGSVYLETFAVFVGGFLLIQLLGEGLGMFLPADTANLVAIGLQWTLVLTVCWPLFRGVPARVWREQIGLVAPRGVMREIGAGVVGYMAGVPMYVAAAIASLALVMIRSVIVGAVTPEGEPAPVIGPSGPVNPVFEMVAGQGWPAVLLLGSLVVLWAPLVEELIMRGALYRHLRSRTVWLLSAVVSAVLFGMLHQYDVLMLLPVISLGLVFAAVREWRGSLIGCMTGHMLHNATIFGLVVAMLVGLG